MDYNITDKSDKKWVLIQTSGSYCLEDNALMLKDLSLLESISKCTGLLIDHSRTTFDHVDLIKISQAVQQSASTDKFFKFKQIALIMPPEGHGKAAMFKFELDSIIDAEIEIFTPDQYRTAFQWLEGTD